MTTTEAELVALYLEQNIHKAALLLSEGESPYIAYGHLVAAMESAARDLRRFA